MKKFLILLTIFFIFQDSHSKKWDEFEYEGINYMVINDDDTEVATKYGEVKDQWGGVSAGNDVQGDLIIPAKVWHKNKEYTVITIGDSSFIGNRITSVQLPETLVTIGQEAFSTSEISDIKWPNVVDVIGRKAFKSCHKLTYLEIPPVRTIKKQAFDRCLGLKVVTLPSTLKEIGKEVFSECDGLDAVIVKATVPPALCDDEDGGYPFDEFTYGEAPLYVPRESIDLYKKAPIWAKFSTILSLEMAGVESPVDEKDSQPDVYDLSGRLVLKSASKDAFNSLPAGVYIVGGQIVIK